jgi:hypothetical protein
MSYCFGLPAGTAGLVLGLLIEQYLLKCPLPCPLFR